MTVASDYKKLPVSTIVIGVDKIVLGGGEATRNTVWGETSNRQTDRQTLSSLKGRNPLGKLVGNMGCQPGLATSFQLVRLVGCGLKALLPLRGTGRGIKQ